MIKGENINSVSTKFYYKEDNLCFQIILSYGAENEVLYKEFENYSTYQQTHDDLVAAINKKANLNTSFNNINIATALA